MINTQCEFINLITILDDNENDGDPVAAVTGDDDGDDDDGNDVRDFGDNGEK